MKLRLSSWITALALAVAGISFAAGPATAAGGYCSGSGVNVVVDFGGLPQGTVQKGCGHGSTATDAFESAGFEVGYSHAGGMNGFVCTIDGQPTSEQCSGANGQGYWALFTATAGGSWSYASLGSDSQPVSDGQTVAFAWQSPQQAAGGGHRNPSAAPGAPVTKPTPKTSNPAPTRTHAGSPSRVAATASAVASPTTKPSESAHHAHKTARATPTPSATVSSSAAALAPATAPPGQPAADHSGLPWWIPVGVVVVLGLGASGAWWRKRAGN